MTPSSTACRTESPAISVLTPSRMAPSSGAGTASPKRCHARHRTPLHGSRWHVRTPSGGRSCQTDRDDSDRVVTCQRSNLSTCSETVRAQTPTLRSGKYEKTSETAIQGRPAKNPPRKDVICLNEPDLKDLTNTALSDDGQKSCKVSNYAVAGTTATFTRTCAARD